MVVVATACGGASTTTEGRFYSVRISPAAAKAAAAVHLDLHRLVELGADSAFERLPHRGRVTIRVSVDASQAIPGIDVGGYTRPNGDVDIFIVAYPVDLRQRLTTWLPKTVAHELHHSSRIRTGPGYGPSLADALVAEGLADRFADTVFPKTPPAPWDHALTLSQERTFWKRAQQNLYEPFGYDHTTWFYEGGEEPRWTGYTLGYNLVEPYLRDHPSKRAAVDVPTRRVLADFRGFATQAAP